MDVQQIAVQVGIKAPHDATAYTIDTELSAKLHDITRGFDCRIHWFKFDLDTHRWCVWNNSGHGWIDVRNPPSNLQSIFKGITICT